MIQEPVCDICGNPTDGYVCQRDTADTAPYLRDVVELADEVETNVARLARYAHHGGRRALMPDTGPDTDPDERRPLPVRMHGWMARNEKPSAGALRPEPLPVDLNASARAAVAFNDVTTWARAVLDDRGHQLPDPQPGEHPAAVAARYLLGEIGWIRHQQFAAECLEQLRAAGAVIRRIVDSPPERELVGRCDCGETLYAYKGAATITCPECNLRWDVDESRQSLIDALREHLVTASEAAVLLALWGFDGNRDRLRKTIVMWSVRGHIVARGETEGSPLYRLDDILQRATRAAAKTSAAS